MMFELLDKKQAEYKIIRAKLEENKSKEMFDKCQGMLDEMEQILRTIQIEVELCED